LFRRDDVALLRLVEAVPPSLAVPADIATESPKLSDWLTEFVNSTSACRTANNPGIRQYVERRRDIAFPIARVCKGDSGGPLFTGRFAEHGDVVAVLSGHVGLPFWILTGDPIRHRSEILGIVDAWAQMAETPRCDATEKPRCDAMHGCTWSWCDKSCERTSTYANDCYNPLFCSHQSDGTFCEAPWELTCADGQTVSAERADTCD
jgi:hypothetical protein